MKTVTVIGAGFSGLTLAYELHRQGMPVRVIEKQKRPGGLITTRAGAHGLIELAANSLLADKSVEKLFADLGVPFAKQLPARKKRYIFWNRPRRWPLSPITSAKAVSMLARAAFGDKHVMPATGESIAEWAQRVVNSEFEERLLTPGLQGIFAGDPRRLSAVMTLKSVLQGRAERGTKKGSVSPAKGMGQLIDGLCSHLRRHDVPIEYQKQVELAHKPESPTVVCTSAWNAAEIVAKADPHLSEQLRHCESLPLVSVTCFFTPTAKDLEGFGCLFPPAQGFVSSGVLFNNCVFSGRSEKRSETWILGGALQPGVAALSDENLRDIIVKERQRVLGNYEEPLEMNITRWPRAIPHYTVQWERIVKEIKVQRPLFLHGNYLGGIGLARIYQRSIALARELKDLYGA